MDIYPLIGQQIKKARESQGIGQKVLARVLGSTPSSISQYETGKRCISLMNLVKIATVLNLPLTYFITLAEDINEKTPISVSEKIGITYPVDKEINPSLISTLTSLLSFMQILISDTHINLKYKDPKRLGVAAQHCIKVLGELVNNNFSKELTALKIAQGSDLL